MISGDHSLCSARAILGIEDVHPVAAILFKALEQARALGAPGEMRNRLRLAGEYASTHDGALPPWLEFHANPKPQGLTIIREEETP